MLVVGGDHPRPSAALARRLVACADDACDVVAVAIDGAPEPLFALYRTAWVDALAETTMPPRSFRVALERARVFILDAKSLDDEERSALEDADTPKDAAAHGLSRE